MRIIREVYLCDFNFWGGAVQVAGLVKDTEWDILEGMIMDLFNGELPSETEVNDLFWFEPDMIADMLGYVDYDTMFNDRYPIVKNEG